MSIIMSHLEEARSATKPTAAFSSSSISRLSAAVVVAAALVGGVGCSTIRSIASDAVSDDSGNKKAKAKTRSQKEIAACEKMCSVAGDVDGKENAVSDCKKECRN